MTKQDRYDVEVIPAFISRGERYSCSDCPIAHALARIGFRWERDGRLEAPIVNKDEVFFFEEGIPMKVNLPRDAASWVGDFDKGEDMKPIRFRLYRSRFRKHPDPEMIFEE